MDTNMLTLQKLLDVEDLPYIESDLNFNQLVSLGFLLYSDDTKNAKFILQRLIVLSRQPPSGFGLKKLGKPVSSDILKNYATLNPTTWREHIVEALAIIQAKMVLRKMGLNWQQIKQHYLPHVAEISLHIHPMLKVLYELCERLSPDQADRLVKYVNTKYKQSFQFYDKSYLELYLLYWLTEGVCHLGSKTDLKGSNFDILIEFFKFNDMLEISDFLLGAINHNIDKESEIVATMGDASMNNLKDSGVSMSREISIGESLNRRNIMVANDDITVTDPFQRRDKVEESEDLKLTRYNVSNENAGYILIINQKEFYIEQDPKYKHLVPAVNETIRNRQGTDVDRDKLKEVFSSHGYKPIVLENLTHLKMLHHIRETVKKSTFKDSLIVCILSHGMEGAVFGNNTVPVYIKEIEDILTDETLRNKPKMLIIQACQRDISEKTVSDRKTFSSQDRKLFSPQAYADMLWALSSIPGTDALRHTEHGSWFIDALCKYIKKYGDSKHMLDILTDVINNISRRKGDDDQVMLPVSKTTLRSNFYLPKKNN